MGLQKGHSALAIARGRSSKGRGTGMVLVKDWWRHSANSFNFFYFGIRVSEGVLQVERR